jgi:XTP/dITP diphosphohydrolase
MNLLLGNLEDETDRSARFRTVIALVRDNEEILIEGICNGRIATSRKWRQRVRV